jgi:protein associated with RNAse G/E
MDKIQNIRIVADGQEERVIRQEYSDDQIRTMEIETISNIKLARAVAREIKILNKKKKEFLDKNEANYENLERGYTESTMNCYYINNHDTNMREYYNEAGEKVEERQLKASEKKHQLRITQAM